MRKYEGAENLRKYFNKNIRVVEKNGKVSEGVFSLYTKAGDNEPEIESISLDKENGYFDIDTPNIKTIELI